MTAYSCMYLSRKIKPPEKQENIQAGGNHEACTEVNVRYFANSCVGLYTGVGTGHSEDRHKNAQPTAHGFRPRWTSSSESEESRESARDRKSTRLNSSHLGISYAVF